MKRMKKTIVALAVVIGVAGCATNPYTGERQVSDTAKGAGIGALAGAGVGALVGGGKGAAIGAGIGGLAGGGIGYYMHRRNSKKPSLEYRRKLSDKENPFYF